MAVGDEVILFEHANFRGAHRHVFQAEEDLNATAAVPAGTPGPAGGPFDKRTSSMVVRGTWLIYTEQHLTGPERKVGPGVYPDVQKPPLKLGNDKIRSLEPAS